MGKHGESPAFVSYLSQDDFSPFCIFIFSSYNRVKKEPEPIREFDEWPLPAEHRELYLRDGNELSTDKATSPSTINIQADASPDDPAQSVRFRYRFEKRGRFLGYSRAILYMSALDNTDFDVYVTLRKADKDGNILEHVNMPLSDLGVSKIEELERDEHFIFKGPLGILRASHRKIDQAASKPWWSSHPHIERENAAAGEVVELTIDIWPAGILFEPGECLIAVIAGNDPRLPASLVLKNTAKNANVGRQTIHIGSEYPSRVVIPFVKYEY